MFPHATIANVNSICVLAIAILALTVEWNQSDCYSSADKCLSYYLKVYRVSAAEPSLILISGMSLSASTFPCLHAILSILDRLTLPRLANVPTLTPLYHRLCGTLHNPLPAPLMERDALDRTIRKKKIDTLNGKLSTKDTEHDSTRGLALNELSCDIESSDRLGSGRTGTARSESMLLHEQQEATRAGS